MLTHSVRVHRERGASMLAALAVTAVVFGLGAVALQLVEDDLGVVERRLDRDEAALHAELGVSQAIGRVVDGTDGPFEGDGVVDGAAYRFVVEPNGGDRWTITGSAGEGVDERTVTAELRRDVTPGEPAIERYAVYGYDLVDIGWVRSGDVAGPVASGDRVRFWYSHSIGTRQDYVSRCDNCPNPEVNTSYVPLELPSVSGAAPCPVDNRYRLTGPVTLEGTYDCSANRRTLRISGTIEASGPVVILVGENTRLDIRNATINVAGDSADFVISKPTTTSWAYRARIDDTEMAARILAPETWMYVGDVTWRGTFEVGTWWLYDWANIDGVWDGDDVATDPVVAWSIDSWQLD